MRLSIKNFENRSTFAKVMTDKSYMFFWTRCVILDLLIEHARPAGDRLGLYKFE